MKTVCVLSIVLLLGCSSSSEPSERTLTPLQTIGLPCAADGECKGLPGGYCSNVSASGAGAPSNVCTGPCAEHSDCGCPPGTTTEDIAAGKCTSVCIGGIDGSKNHACFRVCESMGCSYPDARCKLLPTGFGACVKDSQVK